MSKLVRNNILADDIRRFGSPVLAGNDLESSINSVVRVFAVHDMSEAPIELTDIETLRNYTYDQLVPLPIDFKQPLKLPKHFDEFLDPQCCRGVL